MRRFARRDKRHRTRHNSAKRGRHGRTGETHGTHLAEALSGRRAEGDRHHAVRVAGRAAGGDASRSIATASAFICMDKAITYGELDAMSRDFAAYLQSTGLKFGDRVAVMMPNVLQYPVTTAGILRAGMTVVNVNPLYTPRELEHQLNDSGAEAIVILENFATTLEKVLKNTRVKHVILANMGDMLGFPKGAIVNLVVRKVKKMVPAYSLPRGGAVQGGARGRQGQAAQHAQARAGRCRVPAIHRRHHGRVEGRDAAPSQHRGERAAERCLAAALAVQGAEGRSADDRHRAAALSHLRAHGLLPARDARRRRVPADPESARHSGLREGAAEVQGAQVPGREHAVQRAAQPSGFRQDRLLAAQDRGRRRHGGAARGRGALGQGDRRAAGRRLRALGNRADAHLHAGRLDRVHRHDRPAGAVDRHFDPRRCRQRSADGRTRRDLRARARR